MDKRRKSLLKKAERELRDLCQKGSINSQFSLNNLREIDPRYKDGQEFAAAVQDLADQGKLNRVRRGWYEILNPPQPEKPKPPEPPKPKRRSEPPPPKPEEKEPEMPKPDDTEKGTAPPSEPEEEKPTRATRMSPEARFDMLVEKLKELGRFDFIIDIQVDWELTGLSTEQSASSWCYARVREERAAQVDRTRFRLFVEGAPSEPVPDEDTTEARIAYAEREIAKREAERKQIASRDQELVHELEMLQVQLAELTEARKKERVDAALSVISGLGDDEKSTLLSILMEQESTFHRPQAITDPDEDESRSLPKDVPSDD